MTGFTIIEMVLSIAIIGVLAMLVGPMLITGGKGFEIVSKRKSVLNETRLAMDRFCAEASLIPTTDDIVTFTAANLEFNTPAENNISYTVSGGSLTRKGAAVATGISNLAFTYLDANGNQTAVKADIKRIGIEFSVSAGASYGTLYIRDQVFPRRFSSAYAGYQ
jgi:prepilin-type N-terminal cleavage/methylation domain-containing protein